MISSTGFETVVQNPPKKTQSVLKKKDAESPGDKDRLTEGSLKRKDGWWTFPCGWWWSKMVLYVLVMLVCYLKAYQCQGKLLVLSPCFSMIPGSAGERRGNFLHLRMNKTHTVCIIMTMPLITAPISCVLWQNVICLFMSTNIYDVKKLSETITIYPTLVFWQRRRPFGVSLCSIRTSLYDVLSDHVKHQNGL